MEDISGDGKGKLPGSGEMVFGPFPGLVGSATIEDMDSERTERDRTTDMMLDGYLDMIEVGCIVFVLMLLAALLLEYFSR